MMASFARVAALITDVLFNSNCCVTGSRQKTVMDTSLSDIIEIRGTL